VRFVVGAGARSFAASFRSFVRGSRGSVAPFPERNKLLGSQVCRFAEKNQNLPSPVLLGERCLTGASRDLPCVLSGVLVGESRWERAVCPGSFSAARLWKTGSLLSHNTCFEHMQHSGLKTLLGAVSNL